VGRCDREEKCGFHYTPREYFKANPFTHTKPFIPMPKKPPTPQTFSTLPFSLVTDSQRSYDQNYLMYFLGEMLGYATAEELAKQYHIGTAKHWQGATVFWQVDAKGLVRTGKIMLYNPDDCKRVKVPFNHITWAHCLRYKDYNLKQCLFGEHLLAAEPNKPVAIAESEKTAIIASVYMPGYIWLAAGSLEGLNADKCSVLKGREVTLFPDVNGYYKWRDKAKELNLRIPTATFKMDNTLIDNNLPYDIERGTDIADIWIDETLYNWELEREWGLR
jgi:hypothetical protein